MSKEKERKCPFCNSKIKINYNKTYDRYNFYCTNCPTSCTGLLTEKHLENQIETLIKAKKDLDKNNKNNKKESLW